MNTQTAAPITATVAQIVEHARLSLGLSMREFAKELGVSHNQVGKWEHGIDEPTRDRLADWFTDTGWKRELALNIYTARARAVFAAVIPSQNP